MQIPVRRCDVLGKKEERTKKGEGGASRRNARARRIRLTAFKKRVASGVKFQESRVTRAITMERIRDPNASTIASHVDRKAPLYAE